MARRDYSVALLFQLAVWTTLQFQRLRIAVTIVSSFLKRALHSTLPPVVMAAIVHAFKEYYGGGDGESADFAASAAPYVFAFHMAMGVRLAGSAPLRFGTGGAAGKVPWGRGREMTAREATMAVAQTEGGGSGGGANDGRGNGAALSAIPLLTRATMSWRRGG